LSVEIDEVSEHDTSRRTRRSDFFNELALSLAAFIRKSRRREIYRKTRRAIRLESHDSAIDYVSIDRWVLPFDFVDLVYDEGRALTPKEVALNTPVRLLGRQTRDE
jgi:hypothetical protein